ncbi:MULTISPECIES: nicotinate (nicotinamide) nucleotide adenylyltransferase [Weeksella]|uniref:Probable nicotinate-nucleotide adenylyltransferase n=1 Tax=Weeksella virosa (strain ATCC 43766 / DSM 16922 / JCM 21250 / CCUG 30538 / CDC 9751 / IAM 14551 / NBRC 16016 / NCTC 11634 / CL345/78) TaxID=865938 RepID=F0P1K5_WEEVC|nr:MULTISPECIES: nicotinate (nicotinamide) nucleotide adenylyltransferase [Weeksella]ADX67633.1 nicotinate-nucleotide adenylyltransferase [Weeksella virosa DSM 16922]MDK7375400.1 nicotinate (nicotinamide) nucleotide adenylyltransferase [Weeksella virosa]MDK7676085.1 nicotinate (nicotinamide) nucleotide adenylyltransferase [Weeksella virosa]OFM82989.1 nicotinate-nicotinamide nucleotide adenylyltransferase [Weeksella sp. HMSC059D05]SUP53934.1 Probable nicotinate-nucleotide adenylyltransferase [W
MKVGLFFGSFNPIHIGHLIIANHFQQFSDLEQVWFVVSPQNPFKEKKSLANEYNRLEMVELAIQDYPNLRACSDEFHLPRPSYTIDTLTHLKEKYPRYDFSLIMGSDVLISLPKWKNADILLRDYSMYVYPRPGEILADFDAKITIVEAPLMEISSTFIRNAVKHNKNIKPMLPPKVWEYLDGSNLYK